LGEAGNLRTTNKARSHTHTQAQATQPLHRCPPTHTPTAFQKSQRGRIVLLDVSLASPHALAQWPPSRIPQVAPIHLTSIIPPDVFLISAFPPLPGPSLGDEDFLAAEGDLPGFSLPFNPASLWFPALPPSPSVSPADDNSVPMGHPVTWSYSTWAAEMALCEVTEPPESQSRVAHLLSKCSAVSVLDFCIQDSSLFPDDMDVHHSLFTELAEVNQGRVPSPVLLSQMRSMHNAAVAWDTRRVRPPHRLPFLAWLSPSAATSTIPSGIRSCGMSAIPPAFPAALVTAAA